MHSRDGAGPLEWLAVVVPSDVRVEAAAFVCRQDVQAPTRSACARCRTKGLNLGAAFGAVVGFLHGDTPYMWLQIWISSVRGSTPRRPAIPGSQEVLLCYEAPDAGEARAE